MDQCVKTPDGEAIVLNIARENGDRPALLTSEYVRPGDVQPLRDETWLQGLRSGKLPWDVSALTTTYFASRRGGSVVLAGLVLELSGNGQRVRRLFPPQCFDLTLKRALERPLGNGTLRAEETIHYWLSTARAAADSVAATAAAPAEDSVRVRFRPPAWQAEPARLAQYLDSSEQPSDRAGPVPVEPVSERPPHPPVFFARAAWEHGRQFANRHENLESAAVLTGRLMQDIDSPEVFVVVDACIAAQHAEEQRYSVMLTNESWSVVHRVLDQRRRRLNRPQEIIVGSVHGHPFLPSADERGETGCADCPRLETCEKTTALASSDDISWHRSIFSGQPWALLAIWGWNVRQSEVWQAYGLGGGTLVPRAIRVLTT